MLVKVKEGQVEVLRELEVQTYQETFGPYIKVKDMQDYLLMNSPLSRFRRIWRK